jgi:hypothetical protein
MWLSIPATVDAASYLNQSSVGSRPRTSASSKLFKNHSKAAVHSDDIKAKRSIRHLADLKQTPTGKETLLQMLALAPP